MLSPKPSTSPLIQYLGPLLPLGCGGFCVWLLVSGRYVYRPGRSNSELIPLAPDAYLAAGFFISSGSAHRRSWHYRPTWAMAILGRLYWLNSIHSH